MESVGDIFSDTFKIALYAKEVGRYLCFRKGKLVGMVSVIPNIPVKYTFNNVYGNQFINVLVYVHMCP